MALHALGVYFGASFPVSSFGRRSVFFRFKQPQMSSTLLTGFNLLPRTEWHFPKLETVGVAAGNSFSPLGGLVEGVSYEFAQGNNLSKNVASLVALHGW